MSLPRDPTRQRAERARRVWSDPSARERAWARLNARIDDPTTPAWKAILRGEHRLAAWLAADSDFDALPAEIDGLSVRALFASCPLPRSATWSNPPMSRVS